MKRTFATLAAALALAAPAFGAASYNVKAYGAVGDGATKDTVAVQKALDDCAVNGGGEVVVPSGRYLIGSVQLGTHTVLRLEPGSVLLASPDLGDYPLAEVRWEGRWQIGRRGMIYAAGVDDIGIVGPGIIQGLRGGTNSPDGTRNPVVIEPVSCNHVRWQGFSVVQGGNWATHPTYCTDVDIEGVRIRCNRDGIDVDSCRGVRIEGCDIRTGDDSISIKSGRGMDGARLGRACEDVLIEHCTLVDRNFACVGIGSELSGGVRNIRIEHCRLSSPRSSAIYIKTRIGRAGVNEAISGDDLEVDGAEFLRINLTRAGNSSTSDDPVGGLIGYPIGRDFSFSHVRVKCRTLVQATEISARRPLEGLVLEDITGTCQAGISLANATGVRLSGIQVTGLAGPLLGIVGVTGTGLEGAVSIPAPVDPPPGNATGAPRRGPPRPMAPMPTLD